MKRTGQIVLLALFFVVVSFIISSTLDRWTDPGIQLLSSNKAFVKTGSILYLKSGKNVYQIWEEDDHVVNRLLGFEASTKRALLCGQDCVTKIEFCCHIVSPEIKTRQVNGGIEVEWPIFVYKYYLNYEEKT